MLHQYVCLCVCARSLRHIHTHTGVIETGFKLDTILIYLSCIFMTQFKAKLSGQNALTIWWCGEEEAVGQVAPAISISVNEKRCIRINYALATNCAAIMLRAAAAWQLNEASSSMSGIRIRQHLPGLHCGLVLLIWIQAAHHVAHALRVVVR